MEGYESTKEQEKIEENAKRVNIENLTEKCCEMQEKMTTSINQALKVVAEKLDNTADKMHDTAEFFRDKDTNSLKDDLICTAKKHPTQTLILSFITGFLVGKIFK